MLNSNILDLLIYYKQNLAELIFKITLRSCNNKAFLTANQLVGHLHLSNFSNLHC